MIGINEEEKHVSLTISVCTVQLLSGGLRLCA